MRTSKKKELLQAALTIVERDGIDALTYESLSAASGFSKSGLIYHFPSRHHLLFDLHKHLADQWEQQLREAAGGASAEEADSRDRLRAYVVTQSTKATRADLLLALNAHSHPDYLEVWKAVSDRWSPRPDEPTYLIRLMADGLWLHDSISETPLTEAQRNRLAGEILGFFDKQDH